MLNKLKDIQINLENSSCNGVLESRNIVDSMIKAIETDTERTVSDIVKEATGVKSGDKILFDGFEYEVGNIKLLISNSFYLMIEIKSSSNTSAFVSFNHLISKGFEVI